METNNRVDYCKAYLLFVVGQSREDSNHGGGKDGGHTENSVGAEEVLQIAVPKKSIRNEWKKECANGTALYAGEVIVLHFHTATLYFIEKPSQHFYTTRLVYIRKPEATLPAIDGLFINTYRPVPLMLRSTPCG